MIATVPSAWLDGLSATWLTVLLDTSIKGAVILSVAAVAAAVMRRMSAASRQVVWFLATAGLLVLPVLSLTLPGWRILPDWAKIDLQSGGQAEQAPAVVIVSQTRWDIEIAPPPWPVGAAHAYAPAGQAADLQGDPPAGQASTAPLASAPPPPAPAKSWQAKALPWAMGVWIMGAAIALAPLVLGKLSLWILRRSARPAKDNDWPELLDRAKAAIGLRQNVLLLVSRKPAMPMVWGLFSSRLLIPAEATDWSPQRKWVVLLHELAHVKRWDCATKLLAHVACSVYWFNPLCWIAFRLMQREAEAACDDLVLSSTGVPPVSSMGVSPMSPTGVPPVSIEIDSITSAAIQPCDYADHLLHIASGLRTGILSAHSSIAMARKSKLEGRLLAILDGRRNRRALTRWGLLIAAVLVAAVAVPLAVLKATAATPDGPDSASPSGPATTPASDAASPDGAGAQPGDTQANATPARIAELIEQLGDDNYKVRQKAQQALLQVGWPAIPAIEAAARNGDLERAQRARAIIAEITGTWSDPVDGIRCAVRPVKASFSPDEDIVADIVYRNVSRKPITICVCPDHLYTWVHLFVKTDDNVVVALGRHGTGTYPPLAPADFVMLQPGQTTASRQVITHAERAKYQLKPGQYFLQAEINKINRMDKALPGLGEFIRTHHLPEPWCSGIETGRSPLIIAAQAVPRGASSQPDDGASRNVAVWLALLTKSPIRGLADYHHTVRTYPDPVAPLYKPVPIPYCELEIRRAKDQSRVARIRNTSEFDESDRRRIGQLPDGQYVVAICTGKQRLSNVASLVIDSKYDPAKEPPLRLVAIEPGPGLPGHFVGVRGTGPTPEDPKFGTWSVHCPDLVVDDVKRGLGAVAGSFSPLKPGSQFESMLDLRRYEPAIAIDKPLAMKAVFNQYVSNIVRLPAQQTLGRAWDEATDKALPAPEPQALLVGKVVGADDKPAKGYEVGLASGGGGKRFRENTDDAGAYKFLGVPAAVYQLVCTPPGAGRPSLVMNGITIKADKTVQVDLSFQRKFIMAGVVTHADGKPGSKIDVELGCKDPLSGVEFEDIATTDEHGRYALASPFGNVTYVMVNHARARQPDPQLQAGQNRVSYTLRMQNGRFVAFPAPTPATRSATQPAAARGKARIDGTVINVVTGLPVSGVPLLVSLEPDGESTTRSDQQGRFSLSGLEAGTYSIAVAREAGKEPDWVHEELRVKAEEGRPVVARLEVRRGGLLEVEVVGADTGRSVKNAWVNLREEPQVRPQRNYAGYSEAGGKVLVRLLPGSYIIRDVFENTSPPKRTYAPIYVNAEFAVAEGETHKVKVALPLVPRLKGEVADPDGKPVAGATVCLGPSAMAASVVTGPDGRFELPVVDIPGRNRDGTTIPSTLLVQAQARKLAALVRFVDVEKSVKVQLSPGTVMVGQVVSEEPNKKPLAGIPWQATLLGPGRPADLAELWYAPEEWYKTDAEGRFTTPVLPAGFRYIIRVNGDDRHLATRPFSFNNVIVQANVAKAGTADLGEVVLQKADRSISGTVVDSNGRPVPGAVVRSQGSSLGTWFGQFKGHQPYREVRADSRGRFMLEGICQGRAWLHVQEPGGARGEEFVHVGQDAEDVVIIVRSGGTIAPGAPATPPTTMPDAPMHMPANQPAAAMDDATAARVDQLKKAVGSFDLTLSACNDSIAGSGRMSNRQVVREVVWNLRVGPGQPAARQPGQVDLTPQEAYAAIDLLARQGLLAHKDKFAPSVGKPYLRLELNGVKLIQGTTDEPVLATFLGALPKVLTPAAAGKIAASAKAISAAAPGATTKPAPLGPAETPEQLARRGQIEGIAARLLAAMVKGDIPAAEMLCEGPVLGWKDESYGPPEEFKASISPAGLNTWRLKRSAGSIRGELQNARASLGGVLKTYLTDDEAVVIVKTWHDWGRFLAVTLRCHGGRWLVHDVQDTPAHLTLIGGLCDNMPAKPEPPKTAITDLQAVSLLRGVVLDLDNGSFSLPPTPPVLRAWDIKLDANGENFVRHNDNVKLLALDDARDFLDASRLAGQRMDRLQTGEQNSLPAKTRFFCVATESEEHKRNLAVVEVLGEPDENPVMIWTCRKVAWPARARVSDRSALVAGARTVNEQIALYEVQHLDHMPGLDAKGQFDGQLFDDHLTMRTDYEGKLYRGKGRIDDYPCGPYLDRMPSNPFVAASGAASLVKGGPGPAPKDGASGWWFDTEAKAFGPNHLPSAEPAATQPASSANIMADPAAASTEPAKQVEASASEAEVTAERARLEWGQCQPVKSPATMTAQVSYGKMLPVLLAGGAGDEQGIIRLAFAVFRKTDDAITAELYGQLISWPKSKWRVAMELLPDNGKGVRHQAVVENSGEVMGGMVFTDTGHLDFRFAAAKDLSADRFKVTLEPAAPADPVTGSFTPPDYEALKKKWDYRKSPGPGTIAVDLPLMPRKLSVVDTLWRQVSEEQETDLSILLAHGRNLYWRSDNGTFRSIALFFGSHGPAGREFTETNLPKGIYRMNADTQPNKPGAVFLAGSTGPVDLTGKNNIGKSRIEWFDRASLTVRVVDPQTGKPSIMVPMVVRLPNGLPISTVTDASGLRRLDFLPEGKLTIELGVRDWWSVIHPEVIKTVTVDVRAGQNDTLTIKYVADRPTYLCEADAAPAKATD